MFKEADKVEEDKVVVTDFTELTKDFVGDDKKYKSTEDALNSILPAQEHITKLEKELDALRTSAIENKTSEEMLDELRAELAKVAATQAEPQTPPIVDDVPATKNVEDDNLDISSLISRTLDERDQVELIKKNQDAVVGQALKVWGKEAKVKLYATARANGYTEDMINSLAAQSPDAALHAIGLTRGKDTPMSNTGFTGLRTSGDVYTKLEKPTAPTNWGNDIEVAEYMTRLQEYTTQNTGNN